MSDIVLEAQVAFDGQALHGRAHAAIAEYERDGWWSEPLETAIVAVADAQHPPGHRLRAERALDNLATWLLNDEPRGIGADAAAAALTAGAALVVRGGSADLTDRAVRLVSRACGGIELAVAPLHLALIAWALDDVVANRREAPWQNIRDRLERMSTTGLNSSLVVFATWLADQRKPVLDERLIDAAAPSLAEECILLWVLNSTIELYFSRGGDASHLDARRLLQRSAPSRWAVDPRASVRASARAAPRSGAR